jgi:NADP-dependent 3-hydroxy acid dehydrogenase YdfG
MTQRVLVTAGASGIGREIARTFAANGAKVFVSDINAAGLDALSHESKGVITKVCDNSKRSDVETLIPAAVQTLGGLDVLVNNAGISGPTAPVEEVDPDHWETIMNVNLNGTFNVTRLAIPHLKKSSAGSIIIISSLGGRYGYPNRSPYCTSKWGLIGFAKSLHRDEVANQRMDRDQPWYFTRGNRQCATGHRHCVTWIALARLHCTAPIISGRKRFPSLDLRCGVSVPLRMRSTMCSAQYSWKKQRFHSKQ